MGDMFGPQQAGTTTTTTTQQPWDQQKPYLQDVFAQAKKLYQSGGPSYFPTSTVAQPGDVTTLAQQAQIGRALEGSAVGGAAQQQATDTLNGKYLTDERNPYLDQMVQRSLMAIRPGIDAQFAGNSYGSSAHQGAMESAAADTALKAYYGNYNDERARQMQALGQAPTLANLDYQDIGALANVGQQQDAQSQAQLTDLVNRWNFQQQLPANKLAQYSQLVQGNYGGTGTSSQPYYTNPMATVAGIGASAAGAKK